MLQPLWGDEPRGNGSDVARPVRWSWAEAVWELLMQQLKRWMWVLNASPFICMSGLFNRYPERLLALAALQAIFHYAWKAPGLFLILIRHKCLFIDTSHACLHLPPRSSSPAKALCPLPAVCCAPYSLSWRQAAPRSTQQEQHQLLCKQKTKGVKLLEILDLWWPDGCRMFSAALLWRTELRLQFEVVK